MLFDLAPQPGASIRPEKISLTRRNAQDFGSLRDGQPGEVAEFYKLGRLRIVLHKPVQCLIECQQVLRDLRRHDLRRFQFFANPVSAMLITTPTPSILDKNASHGFSGGTEKMSPAIPVLRRIYIDQTYIGFVHQRGGLERLSFFFATKT